MLQARNDVFKVWTPLLDFYSLVSPNLEAPLTYDGKTITAKIGTKEGLRGGEQFAVMDEDGNFYGYVVAQPGKVWDNDDSDGPEAQRYYVPQVDKKGKPVTCTTFKGKVKGIRTGMLLSNPRPSKKTRIAARIGTKEGVDPNDGYTVYQYDAKADKLIQKGYVRPVKGKIWDNMYYNDLRGTTNNTSTTLKKRDKEGLRTTETLFHGNCKLQPGMFLRKSR